MRKTILGALIACSLVVPAPALAGGWATAGLTPAQPPDGSGPGDPWVATVTVLQHGMTPLPGVKPVLTLTDTETGERLDFQAKPTRETGAYRVVVTLPESGTWNVSVYDGFTQYGGAQTHTFAPITVGEGGAPSAAPSDSTSAPAAAPAAAADGRSVALWTLGLATLAAALGAALAALVRRSRRKAAGVT
jgi:hypothetical protein